MLYKLYLADVLISDRAAVIRKNICVHFIYMCIKISKFANLNGFLIFMAL